MSANGIDLHVTERGEGPPVVLCHGFPELGYSWRHQVPALAEGGYRAIVPDMRGYGLSSRPTATEAYDVLELCGDMVGLLDALGEERAVFAGHDWGAAVVWQLAVVHPERVEAVVGMSVPFLPRPPAPPLELLRQGLGDDFYIVWFQEPGVADEALARDVRRTLATKDLWDAEWAEGDGAPDPPRWMNERDLSVYVEAFERTGFTGGLNWYRNLDRNWELTEKYAERKVEQPALFIAGSRDQVLSFMPHELMDDLVPGLREKVIVEGAGHWIQQERPEEVNRALLAFLDSLRG